MELPVKGFDEDELLLDGELDEEASFIRVCGERLLEEDVLASVQGLPCPSCAPHRGEVKNAHIATTTKDVLPCMPFGRLM